MHQRHETLQSRNSSSQALMNNHVFAPAKDHQAVLCSLRKSRDNSAKRMSNLEPCFEYVDAEVS